jgi:uncharacterized protein YkwD
MLGSAAIAPAAFAETFDEAVIRITNEYRAAGHTCVNETGVPYYPPAPALSLNALIGTAAQNHANYMALNSVLGHYESSDQPGYTGGAPVDRAIFAGYRYSAFGENALKGNVSPEEAVLAWLGSSSGHCKNLMDPLWQETGVGRAYAFGGVEYWNVNFGRPDSTPLAAASIDNVVSSDGWSWVDPVTVAAPTDQYWFARPIPVSGSSTGEFRVEVWNHTTREWVTAGANFGDRSAFARLAPLTSDTVNADQQATLRTVVYATAYGFPISETGPSQTLQFKSAAGPQTTSTTLTAPTEAISRAGTFTMSGTITSGVPVGSTVALRCEQFGGAYGDCGFGGSGQVTASGVWSSTGNLAPADAVEKTVIASFEGVTGWAASQSAPVTITFAAAAPATLGTVTPTSAASGTYPTITGTITGLPNSTPVDLEWSIYGQIVRESVWVTNGTFTFSFDYPITETATFRVLYSDGVNPERELGTFQISVGTSGGGTTPAPQPTYAPPAPQPTYTAPAPVYTPPVTTPVVTSPVVTVAPPAATAAPQIPITVKRTTVTGKLAKKQVRKVKLQRMNSSGVWKTVKTKKTSKTTGKVKFYSLKKGTQYRLHAPKKLLNGTLLPQVQSSVFTR